MLFSAARTSRLRTKKPWLSQKHLCLRSSIKINHKTSGELKAVLVYESCLQSMFSDVMPLETYGLLTSWWCFSPEAVMVEDSASSQIPYYLSLVWRIPSSDWSGTDYQSFCSLVPWEGGRRRYSVLLSFPCASDEGTLLSLMRGICCVMSVAELDI